ncbi:S1/P1 Nuclease [Arachidicoccus ginsenosidimutans]|uniref:S1/P1 nuclease n=1 Tax=Arachidicoccus sp. BS20 TaxID=1850526 RepID=UPI0007F0F982|nr:S1/P1 nuclease [Arachidicoccus sp. BS20]ANI90495.1 S1/P1 Nuclease [Arachidicoccus sp. BS20]
MIKNCLYKIAVVVAFVFISQSVFAWGTTGHRVVAEIAERHLTKKAKKNIAKLFGREPLAFWANWADFIKSDTTGKWKEVSAWHYVDLPGHLSKDEFVKALKAIDHKSLYSQIPAMENILKDNHASLEDKEVALRLLIHFVGDLHQPLHVGRPEDKGGNDIEEFWFGKQTNLHAIWDDALVDYQKWSYTEYADNIDVASKEAVAQIQSGTLEDWFYQSHELADEIYDRTPANSHLSYKYNYMFYWKLNQQLLDGGLRLAEILNNIFG